MALGTSLTTSEVLNSAGSEVEFLNGGQDGRQQLWIQSSEAPSAPHRIRLSHQEKGSGLNRVRESLLEVSKTVDGADPLNLPVTFKAQLKLTVPVGNTDVLDEAKNVMAELGSLAFLLSGTYKSDGTGNAAAALIGGTIP
jgi:hypothetical protein